MSNSYCLLLTSGVALTRVIYSPQWDLIKLDKLKNIHLILS